MEEKEEEGLRFVNLFFLSLFHSTVAAFLHLSPASVPQPSPDRRSSAPKRALCVCRML